MDTKIDFKDPAYYENRELSWIKFDQRVLSEARINPFRFWSG